MRLVGNLEPASANVIDVLDIGDIGDHGDIGLRVKRVARVFVKVGSAQQPIAELTLGRELARPGFFGLQVRVVVHDHVDRDGTLVQLRHGRQPHRTAHGGLEYPIGSQLPCESRLGRSVGFVAFGECQGAGRIGDRTVGSLPALDARAEGGAPCIGEMPAVLRDTRSCNSVLPRNSEKRAGRVRRLSSRPCSTPAFAAGSHRAERRNRSTCASSPPGAPGAAQRRARASRCRPDR